MWRVDGPRGASTSTPARANQTSPWRKNAILRVSHSPVTAAASGALTRISSGEPAMTAEGVSSTRVGVLVGGCAGRSAGARSAVISQRRRREPVMPSGYRLAITHSVGGEFYAEEILRIGLEVEAVVGLVAVPDALHLPFSGGVVVAFLHFEEEAFFRFVDGWGEVDAQVMASDKEFIRTEFDNDRATVGWSVSLWLDPVAEGGEPV